MPVTAWLERHPRSALVIATAACLAPFLGKAFHIDDPLFLWTAAHIQQHPLAFYDFDINWYGHTQPMHVVTKNPPLTCYYLALAGAVIGFSEIAMHAAMLPVAVMAVLGAHAVARRCGAGAAAWLVIAAPVFVVSATGVMCDVMLLACWCWAVAWWMDGIERRNNRSLIIAGLLVAAAALTKYFGIALLPLLAAYAIMRRRDDWRWSAVLALPIALLLGYQVWTHHLFGRGLLGDAMDYSITYASTGDANALRRAAVALGFVGGCLMFPLLAGAWLWRARGWVVLIGLGVGAAMLMRSRLDVVGMAHIGVFVAAAAALGALVVSDLRARGDASSWLLAFWVIGTAVFAGYVNWSINGRSVLPMTPAAAILAVRAIERSVPVSRRATAVGVTAAVSLAIALAVTWGDAAFAAATRRGAEAVTAAHRDRAERLWFQGHWGFQWYMQRMGAEPLDFRTSRVMPNDLVVTPLDNTNIRDFQPPTIIEGWHHQEPLRAPASTMSSQRFSGFYSNRVGGLPYRLGGAPPLDFLTMRLRLEDAGRAAGARGR